MPCSAAKTRILLKEKKAVVKRRTPFTIQLTIATGETKQPVSLGVDAGYKHIGLSASTEKAELYASEIELRFRASSGPQSSASRPSIPQDPLSRSAVRQPQEGKGMACAVRGEPHRRTCLSR